eukprot:3173044-Pyramimonas_sp.AAC.1
MTAQAPSSLFLGFLDPSVNRWNLRSCSRGLGGKRRRTGGTLIAYPPELACSLAATLERMASSPGRSPPPGASTRGWERKTDLWGSC